MEVHRGGEDRRLEAINVPHGDLPERGVGELFERGEEGTLRSFINTAFVEARCTARGRSLACHVPSHLQARRGSGVGELVPQVEMNKAVNVRHPNGSRRGNPKKEVTRTMTERSEEN